jgi:PAS domain S-box-containing protein
VAVALTVLGFVFITSLNINLGTVRTPVAASYLFWILLVGGLFELRGLLLAVAASSLAILGLIQAQNAGLLPPPDYSVTLTQWFTYTALFGIGAGVVYYTNQTLRTALTRSRNEIELRQRSEADLRKLSMAVEQGPAAVMITDRMSKIEYVNPHFEEITGYVKAELLGHNPRILKSGLTPAETYRTIWSAIGAGGSWRGELCNRKKSGELYWESASISGVKDQNGAIAHYVMVAVDITASKQAAQSLQAMHRREMEIAAIIQRFLVSDVPEGIEGAWLAQYADPSQIVDGDFCSIHRFHPGCFEVLVGDVMGKGIQAALMGAAIITAYNRALAELLIAGTNSRSPPSPAEIVNAVHQSLTPQLIAISSFATLALYRFDLDAGTLTYVNAGHTPGLLTRAGGAPGVAILGENLPIGVMPHENYLELSLAMGPGDSLLVFSDGITEARNPQGEEFGLTRLADLIEAGSKADLRPTTIMQALRGEQRRFTGGGPGADDLTAVMVTLQARRGAPDRRVEDRVAPFVFNLPWNLEGLASLRARIMANADSLPADDADALILASFEAATNIIRHGRILVGNASISCRITRESDALVVELIYPSEAFTPPAQTNPDMSGVSEGGFGLYIIEQSVDSVEYNSPMPGVASIRLVKRASTASS